jgi:hypothetical protein
MLDNLAHIVIIITECPYTYQVMGVPGRLINIVDHGRGHIGNVVCIWAWSKNFVAKCFDWADGVSQWWSHIAVWHHDCTLRSVTLMNDLGHGSNIPRSCPLISAVWVHHAHSSCPGYSPGDLPWPQRGYWAIIELATFLLSWEFKF